MKSAVSHNPFCVRLLAFNALVSILLAKHACETALQALVIAFRV